MRLGAKERLKRVTEAPPKRFAKYSVGFIVGGFAFGWIAFPYILSYAVSKLVTLGEGSDIRVAWKKLPQSLDFSIYIFNITNPKEVQEGSVAKVEEIGPFIFEEYKEKVDLVEDLVTDTITYSNKATWFFMKERSHPLTGEEPITIPHLPLMAVLLIAESDFPPPLLPVVDLAIPSIYGELKDAFLRASAMELMFDGITLDCRARSLLPRAVCIAVKQNSRSLLRIKENLYKFSFFGNRNGSVEDVRMTVKRGTRDVLEIGKLVEIDGKSENTVWWGEECNRLQGTDSTVFPPFRRPDNNSFLIYAPEVCKSILGSYEREAEYKGVRGHQYSLVLGDATQPSQRCYCPTPAKCLKKGATELIKCIGAPLVASLPHFYGADESYIAGVEGLRPEKEKHLVLVTLEPVSGTPLMARKRLQFNVPMHPIRFVNITKNLKPTLMPVFWVEESLDLGEELMGMLEGTLLRNLRLVEVVKWSLLGAGVCAGLAGAALHLRNRRRNKVRPFSGGSSRPPSPLSTLSRSLERPSTAPPPPTPPEYDGLGLGSEARDCPESDQQDAPLTSQGPSSCESTLSIHNEISPTLK